MQNKIDNLCSKLDTTFELAVAEAKIDSIMDKIDVPQPPVDNDDDYDELAVLDDFVPEAQPKSEVAVKEENALPVILKDYDFSIEKLKDSVNKTVTIMDKITAELNVSITGNSPKMFDSFANVSNALTNQLREVRELNKLQMGVAILEKDKEREKDETKIEMTPAQLLKLIKEGQKENDIKVDVAEYEEM